MNEEDLITKVIQCAYNVRAQLMAGYLETVYRKALVIELQSQGFTAEEEVPINVFYKGVVVGEYRADIVVDKKIIIELKAVQSLLPVHEAQLVNYLTATNLDHGILINFGSDKIEIRRKYRVYKKTKSGII